MDIKTCRSMVYSMLQYSCRREDESSFFHNNTREIKEISTEYGQENVKRLKRLTSVAYSMAADDRTLLKYFFLLEFSPSFFKSSNPKNIANFCIGFNASFFILNAPKWNPINYLVIFNLELIMLKGSHCSKAALLKYPLSHSMPYLICKSAL